MYHKLIGVGSLVVVLNLKRNTTFTTNVLSQ